MSSQQVWAIEELVRLICSLTLKYTTPWADVDDQSHDGLVLDLWSRQRSSESVLFLNRFISRIAVEVFWRDLGSLRLLCALLPPDYCRKVESDDRLGSKYVSGLNRCNYLINFDFLME
jgi:hypothetical protein